MTDRLESLARAVAQVCATPAIREIGVDAFMSDPKFAVYAEDARAAAEAAIRTIALRCKAREGRLHELN